MLATESPSSPFRKPSLWRRFSRRESRSISPPDDSTTSTASPQKLRKRVSETTRGTVDKSTMITHTHMQRVEAPRIPPITKSAPLIRVVPSDMQTTSFPIPAHTHTVAWNVFLTPEQIYSLVMGFKPEMMEDKWFICSQGPDRTGKLKVHFHRSWTGMKIAELFVVIDLKGEGAGKIVGIKWNGSDQTNGMNEEEAKYMIATTCEWVLGVDMTKGMS